MLPVRRAINTLTFGVCDLRFFHAPMARQAHSHAQREVGGFLRATIQPSKTLPFPGDTSDTTLMVRELIEKNHHGFHIYETVSCEYLGRRMSQGQNVPSD